MSAAKLRIAGFALSGAVIALAAAHRAGAEGSGVEEVGVELETGTATVWRDGAIAGHAEAEAARADGLFVVDLGDDWVPLLFRGSDYEATFRALANEALDEGLEGARAARDRYLEVYGIPPSLGVLRARFYAVRSSRCRRRIALAPLRDFEGAPIDMESEPGAIAKHEALPAFRGAVEAAQERLRCDGHLAGGATGRFDARTRAALAEFERRHRIYARARFDGPTLDALRTPPLELERQALVRVITERVLLTEGIVEDGSVVELGGTGGAPDRVTPLVQRVERAFGLSSAAGALRFLERLGDVPGHHLVAFEGMPRPAYASADMDLSVEIDRGDVWYELPFDEEGRPIRQPIERGPTLTLSVEHEARRLPLVRYRTTIGGWRILNEGGREVWRYMESPVGPRVWSEIVSAPVWLPPGAYPDESLVTSLREGIDGKPLRELDRNLVGPSYASAYGLVAAYHRRFARSAKGGLVVLGDEGIRTHGSSDYTSPWHEVSLGCHRLRNHLAVRLFTFLLRHRPHHRVGHRPVSYVRAIAVEGFAATLRIERSGYVFALDRPVVVDVRPGRVLGPRRRPPTAAVPVTHPVGSRPVYGPISAPVE